MLSVNILTHHGDATNDGANLSETVLTPANVNSTDFGKLFSVKLDGQMYAQPLYVQNVNITRGSSPGVHSVVYAATQHDSLYAIDANTGQVLWQDSFLNIANPRDPDPDGRRNHHFLQGDRRHVDSTGTRHPRDPGHRRQHGRDLPQCRHHRNPRRRHPLRSLWAVSIASGAVVNSTVIADTIFDSDKYTHYTGYKYVSGPIVNGTRRQQADRRHARLSQY